MRVHHLLAHAKQSLIWLDGADVLTTRAAINLAKIHQAVIHIPSSAGQQHIRRVKAFDGWLGTTLAEMAEHSELIITLGDQWIHRTPLLAARWITSRASQANRQWWHISPQESPDKSQFSKQVHSSSELSGYRRTVWPRDSWYQRLTNLLQKIRGAEGTVSADSADDDLDNLAKSIAGSINTTILWETSELNRPEDEVLVHRLFQLSQWVSTHSVCNLLALDSEVGHETARSTLMWLTGCQTTARFDGNDWSCPDYSNYFRLNDWQEAFDACLLIRATESLEPLPDVRSHLTLCSTPTIVSSKLHQEIIPVATSGMESEAFLLRGDHAVALFSGCSISNRLSVDESPLSVRKYGPPSTTGILQRASEMASYAERPSWEGSSWEGSSWEGSR
jgi:hypothetical protein